MRTYCVASRGRMAAFTISAGTPTTISVDPAPLAGLRPLPPFCPGESATLRTGLSAPQDTEPDVPPPPPLYFYRAAGANCGFQEGP